MIEIGAGIEKPARPPGLIGRIGPAVMIDSEKSSSDASLNSLSVPRKCGVCQHRPGDCLHLTPNRLSRAVIDHAALNVKVHAGETPEGHQLAVIWQTAYLEARPQHFLKTIHFSPDIDHGKVGVRATLDGPAAANCELKVHFKTGGVAEVIKPVAAGSGDVSFEIPIANARLWSLDDPFLYEVDATLRNSGEEDLVAAYFGMRKISVMDLPGTKIPYIALNNKPLYLQMVLDQSYHPEGFYTFPSDTFMREEILNEAGKVLHRNFTTFRVGEAKLLDGTTVSVNGSPRKEVRVRWWDREAANTARDAIYPRDPSMELVPIVHPRNRGYEVDAPPVFFGHYAAPISESIVALNAACLDFGIGKGGQLGAFRWDGESRLEVGKLCW